MSCYSVHTFYFYCLNALSFCIEFNLLVKSAINHKCFLAFVVSNAHTFKLLVGIHKMRKRVGGVIMDIDV